MANKLDGFLEFVTLTQFTGLRYANYNSMYSFLDENGVQHWCILFGPLALVNSDEALVNVGFNNFDLLGTELFWETTYCCSRYSVVQNAGEADEMIISGRYSSFLYVELPDAEDDDNHVAELSGHEVAMMLQFETVGDILVRKVSMYNRVKMSYTRLEDEEAVFVAGQEVKMPYII